MLYKVSISDLLSGNSLYYLILFIQVFTFQVIFLSILVFIPTF